MRQIEFSSLPKSVFLFLWCVNTNYKNSQASLTTHLLAIWKQESGIQKQETSSKENKFQLIKQEISQSSVSFLIRYH